MNIRTVVFMIISIFLLPAFSHSSTCKPSSLKVTSWNIRDLGKSKDDREIEYIARQLRDSDIVAIQEVVAGYGGEQAMSRLDDKLDRMGSKWDYVVSSRTTGQGSEKYGFLWKTSKAFLRKSSLINEIHNIVDREPFLGVFRVGNKNIRIINFHAVPTKKRPSKEIKKVSSLELLNRNISTLFLGDFNLSFRKSAFNGLRAKGYESHIRGKTALKRKRKFGKHLTHEYDNIFSKGLSICTSGINDFSNDFQTLKQARYISDHLPVFVQVNL